MTDAAWDAAVVTRPLVLYHGKCITQDGFCAAFLAASRWSDAELVPVDYSDFVDVISSGDGTSTETFLALGPDRDVMQKHRITGRHVLILDFSFKRLVTTALLAAGAASFLCLDHHVGAQRELEGLPGCVFDMGRSGAGLALDYFFPEARRPAEVFIETFMFMYDGCSLDGMIVREGDHPAGRIENSVRALYVESIDLWKFDFPGAREVQIFLEGVPRTVEAWRALPSIGCMREQGGAMRAYQRGLIESIARNAYVVSWPEGPILVANSSVLKNEVADALLRRDPETFAKFEKPDRIPEAPAPLRACLIWYRDERGKVVCSLRSHPEGADCSLLAKKFGGSGHARAAGFALEGGRVYGDLSSPTSMAAPEVYGA